MQWLHTTRRSAIILGAHGSTTHRGNAYGRSGQYQRAIQDYNEAIRRAPKFAEPYAGRVCAYILLSKGKEAQLDIVRAIELGSEATLLKREIEELKKQR